MGLTKNDPTGGELTDEMVPVRGRLGYALPIAAGLGIWPACLFEYGVVISKESIKTKLFI